MDCSTIKMACSLSSLQPPQILNINGDMEPLGKHYRIHCKKCIPYIKRLMHFWETNIPARSKSSKCSFWWQLCSTGDLHLLPSCRLQSEWWFSCLGYYHFLKLRKLLCSLRCWPFRFQRRSINLYAYCQNIHYSFLLLIFRFCRVGKL